MPSIIEDKDIYFNEGSESDIIADDLDDKKPGACRDDFIEIFSRPRLIPRISALHLGMVASMSVDILTGFDLLLPEERQETMTYLWARRPRSAVLSPPCTMFSQLMNTNWARMDPAVVKARWQEAMVLLKFALDVARFMIDTGGYFILEHPTGASSWRLPDVQALIAMPSAYLVTFHQCRFNLRGRPLVVCQYGKAQGF